MKSSGVFKAIIIVLILLLAGVLAGGGYYLKKQSERPDYFANTTVNGYDVSGKTPEQALSLLAGDYGNVNVTLTEGGQDAVSGMLADFGYIVDQDKLSSNLKEVFTRQRNGFSALIRSLSGGNTFTVTIPFKFYDEKLNELVNAGHLPSERVVSVDAKMQYNEKENYYYIEPEVNGTEFDDSSLQTYVRDQIADCVSGNHPGEDLTISFPEDIYIKPVVTEGDVALNTTVNVYNQFCKAKITYVFGSQKEMIDWNTIQGWLSIQDGQGVLDDTKVSEYVISIAAKYNTRHYDRTFHTSYGTDIVIPSSENDYGYTVNEEEECRQLVADIRSNTEVEREPVYYATNRDYGNPLYYKREGRDDLAGTYVEVNLTTQHLWFYKDYAVIMDTDIVSGCVAKKAETKTGTFALAYKESPSVLVGTNAEDGYETEVKYWMPFYEGQGLHDADWRTSFGGNIYLTNGSHGCVNLPPYAAEAIYNNIDAGVAIIIYK